ncbi:signal recognition particle receptor subunit alpha [Nostoc sphaeroides]|uniref:signal recognition particle receptor subunit alpha n=1 Tax=Nostoc sphaeroides TaxID=446679 RepID=UPI003977E233
MVFNWFRRKYNDSSDTPSDNKQEETPPAQEPQPEPAETSRPTTETAPDTTTDLLAFAKAAYKNIQQKQQAEVVETPANSADASVASAQPEPAETAIAEITEPEAIEEPVSTKVETAQPEVIQAATEEESTEDSSVAAIADQDVTSPELTINEAEPTPTEPVATPEATQPTALSFLERAAAERQAKLEQLMATAIEVPEPEVVQPVAATSETGEEIPGLVFDDGFVWSAKVLAAQGRSPEDVSIEEITWLKKLRQGLDKTRRSILNQLKAIVGQGPLNQAAVTEIEALLLQADVGVEATDFIINALQTKLREEVTAPEEAISLT